MKLYPLEFRYHCRYVSLFPQVCEISMENTEAWGHELMHVSGRGETWEEAAESLLQFTNAFLARRGG